MQLTSTTVTLSDCRRANVSSLRVSAAARFAELAAASVALDLTDPPGFHTQPDHVQCANHAGKYIVEVMGDAPGQLTNRIHFCA